MTSPARSSEPKAARLAIRASARQDRIIRQAAEATGKTVTSFVLDAAYTEAQRSLADRSLFRLDEPQWKRFTDALERPTVKKPRLRKLLRTPGVLD